MKHKLKLGDYATLESETLKVEINIKGLKEYKAKLNEVLEIITNLEENIEQLNKIKLEIEI